ncbi:MAG: MBL fold metallo-hydrolase [Actinobacteria bacterium]|jgi:glyoxylase-like metal-dependent hydrolase (beta-lactamase superfamily II)|nr:MBL fold metallo-hydrolase [Actinomycetota bacterium]
MAKIKTIRLLLPFKLGSVNCYLIENDSNYVLIDTGGSNQRTELERQLENAGCKPGHLKLIVITHGDFDHTGNAAYLRHKFAVQVAMHQCDSRMAEYGNMFANRKKPNILIQKIIPILSGFGKKERFKPDILIEEGDDLTAYGLSVNVLSIPGHSEGSIGILMDNSDLFCGDLFENKENPLLNSIMDDIAAAKASVEKLKRLEIKTVYPGHGKPFLLKQFINSN